MSKAIMITGCQRSGTNLLNLILDSHPQVQGLDEMDLFHWEVIGETRTDAQPDDITVKDMEKLMDVDDRIATHLADPEHPAYVSFQLPPYASNLNFLRSLASEMHILWCLRNPRDVVASMLKFQIPFERSRSVSSELESNVEVLPWSIHPAAEIEIDKALPHMSQLVRQELSAHFENYHNIRHKSLRERTRQDAVFMAAFCWRLKNELVLVYEHEHLPYRIIRYEQIIREPKQEIEKVLEYLDLPWDENVLHHHESHTGLVSGQTDAARPIDATNVNKWKGALADTELAVIQDVTSSLASQFGYPV